VGLKGIRKDFISRQQGLELNDPIYNPPESEIKKRCDTLIFIAALSTIATLWKQPRCPTTDEWIKKM
jgi:hypothetical protein